jgi:hypothetical protein
MNGYIAALASSVGVGLGLRKATMGMMKGVSGSKLLFINFVVSCSASMTANFFNSMCMRYPEIDRGITVYSDKEQKHPVGVSKVCASNAVYETAYSRIAMSFICLGTPTFLNLFITGVMKISPAGRAGKFGLDILTIGTGLYIGLPISVAIFPSESVKTGASCEPEFHKHENIYFNKGL